MGDLAYVADWNNGLLVLNVMDPTKPKLVERFETPGHADRFHAAGNTGYILDGEWGLQIMELRPRFPQRIDFRIAPDLATTDFPRLLEANSSSELPLTLSLLKGPATLERWDRACRCGASWGRPAQSGEVHKNVQHLGV